MALESQNDVLQLKTFFETLYQDTKGLVYLATKDPKSSDWEQFWFEWPNEKANILAKVNNEFAEKEVYFGPALYADRKSDKPSLKGSHCIWSEFDGVVPSEADRETAGIPAPSVRIQSGLDGHEHWYWLIDRFLSVPEIELANRKITYALGADVSGWDSTQVLRPPGTRNHKRDRPVKILLLGNDQHVYTFTDDINDPPPVLELPVPTEIPAVEDVIAKCSIPPKLFQLFKVGLPEGHRSEGLMALAFGFAELKPMLNNDELLAVMLNADNRWGKFSERKDQVRRLLDIISKVRIKVPFEETTEEEQEAEFSRFQQFGFTEILSIDTQMDWVWEGFLHAKGYMLVTGAPGVGKSQFSLDFAANACLGKDYLGRTVHEPRKIGFMSLEMGVEEVQHFIGIQSKNYTAEELELLNQNLLIWPMGEPLYLSEGNEANRTKVEELIGDHSLDGVIFDSLGSTTPDELVSEKVRGIMDWNDRLRKKMECFTWFVHHHRKASGDNKRPNKLSDVYGSVYITARASSVLCLWETNGALSLIPLKIRLSKRPGALTLARNEHLHFDTVDDGIQIVTVSHDEAIQVKSNKYNSKDDLPLLQSEKGGIGFT